MYGNLPYNKFNMQSQQIINNNQEVRSERLEARVSPKIKSLLIKAAELEGTSLSDFITGSAKNAADKILRDSKILEVSAYESLEFIKAILNSPRPNLNLRKAYLKYKKSVSSR